MCSSDLTGAEKRAAQTAEGKLSAALEAGARRAETLQERQGDGTMGTTRYSLKEDGDHGRAREETRAEFERRCLEEGYQVLAGADTRYGYRGVRSAGEAAGQVQAELERLGVPCFVKEGAVLKKVVSSIGPVDKVPPKLQPYGIIEIRGGCKDDGTAKRSNEHVDTGHRGIDPRKSFAPANQSAGFI